MSNDAGHRKQVVGLLRSILGTKEDDTIGNK